MAIQLSLKNLKYIKVPLTSTISSEMFINCLESKILTKNETIEEKQVKSIVYIDDLHLGNEETTEMIRYMLENKAYFEIKNKETVEIPPIIFIAERNL